MTGLLGITNEYRSLCQRIRAEVIPTQQSALSPFNLIADANRSPPHLQHRSHWYGRLKQKVVDRHARYHADHAENRKGYQHYPPGKPLWIQA
jgi:hypothetical protein